MEGYQCYHLYKKTIHCSFPSLKSIPRRNYWGKPMWIST